MNSKEILWPDKQLTDQIQKAKEIQRRTLSRRPLCPRDETVGPHRARLALHH